MNQEKISMKYPGPDGKERQFLYDAQNGIIAYKGFAKDFQEGIKFTIDKEQ